MRACVEFIAAAAASELTYYPV